MRPKKWRSWPHKVNSFCGCGLFVKSRMNARIARVCCSANVYGGGEMSGKTVREGRQIRLILALALVLCGCERTEPEHVTPASEVNVVATIPPLHNALRNRGRNLLMETIGAADFDNEVVTATPNGDVICGRGTSRADRRTRYYISMTGRVWLLSSDADGRWAEYCASGRALEPGSQDGS
jgi:hypothetical protein